MRSQYQSRSKHARRDALAERAEDLGVLSAHRTGKRVVVRQERHWDLLGEEREVIAYQNLYRCLDLLVAHKEGLFGFLKQRWQDLFNAGYDVLLYDLTRTYFECDPPGHGKRRYGCSRDKRFDCVQVVTGLSPEGFPLAYEVLAGNTSNRTTLRQFLEQIERQYGKANRVWIMDRGRTEMRQSETPVY